MTDWRAVLDDDLRLPDGLSLADAAAELTEALRSPDPVLRDELALTVLLDLVPRLDPAMRRTLGASMEARLQDPEIQARTFAALILAERADFAGSAARRSRTLPRDPRGRGLRQVDVARCQGAA